MALSYSKVSVEVKEILLNNRPPELLAVSIKGTVPVLCINDTTVIDESLDIMKWALIQNDPNLWIQYNKEMQFDIIEENDNEFKYWLDRYKYYDRYPENDQNYYKKKCAKYLFKLNILLENNRYILSNQIRLIDVAILPFVRQFSYVDEKWFNDHYPNIDNCCPNFY